MSGRKRHLVVDTLGLLMAVVVHAADIQDRDGTQLVLAQLLGRFPRLQLIWADGGYAGALIAWTRELGGWALEIVRRYEAHAFAVLSHRWVVERTLAWLGRYRRLSKDYEALPATKRELYPHRRYQPVRASLTAPLSFLINTLSDLDSVQLADERDTVTLSPLIHKNCHK